MPTPASSFTVDHLSRPSSLGPQTRRRELLATEPLRHGTQQWLDAEVKRYVASGDYDSNFAGWPGDNFVDVAQNATQRLRTALVEETIRRVDRIPSPMKMPENLHLWSRTKLSPMVDGLFSADQRSIVLNTLASSIVFLTPQNIASVLADQRWLSTPVGSCKPLPDEYGRTGIIVGRLPHRRTE